MRQDAGQSAKASGPALCSICQCPLLPDEPSTRCPDCESPYHLECWEENRGCAVYGCPQVPPTEHRKSTEIPVSYWGREGKPCPACGAEILAAAVRCRHCGATFSSERPETSDEYDHRVDLESRAPELKRSVIWHFILCVIPVVAAIGTVIGVFWYLYRRKEINALPSLYPALSIIGLGVGALQTVLLIAVTYLFSVFGGS